MLLPEELLPRVDIASDIAWPALAAFVICVILCKLMIPVLHRLKFGQFIREEGPESHKAKAGTPTMGGIMIFASFVAVGIYLSTKYSEVIPVLIVAGGFGLVGFADDIIKIGFKRSEGLTPLQKMAGQFIVTACLAVYLHFDRDDATVIRIPFADTTVDLGWFYYVLIFVMVIGTVNGSNFTDGLDGLATSVTSVIAVFFTVAGALYGFVGISAISAVMLGALLGFLVFNCHPAKVFMGDTGSLMLGGYTAAAAIVLRQPFIIIIVAFIYLIEVVSVIIQVLVFKATHGQRRFFRMAPIHHHFELGGWEETKVVTMFTLVTTVLMMVGFIAL
ncbi:MAG: phospho-N-acetylmuramoyl-pentapeptide-transferase [Eubacterium sp.]|nr:phospho-N-acetylmuramoyl-pentapeptide-transferase [Eubacterium sp.]HBE10752.1 phospho-N-acetylmuramoyl-pentapeptide-transferase [Lachnospiraceae bacterium]